MPPSAPKENDRHWYINAATERHWLQDIVRHARQQQNNCVRDRCTRAVIVTRQDVDDYWRHEE